MTAGLKLQLLILASDATIYRFVRDSSYQPASR